MSFKVEFEFNSLPELQSFLANTPHPSEPAPLPPVETSDGEATLPKKRGPKPKTPQPADLPVGEEVPTFIKAKPEPEAPPVPAEPKITYEYVAKATTDSVKAVGREPVVALLKELGSATARELPESLWPQYMKRCGELMKSKEDELA